MADGVAQVEPLWFLKMLAHDVRWKALVALAHSDYRVHELVAIIDQPLNLVSYHLKKLRQLHLVSEHRSSSDARDVYYSMDLARVHDLYIATGMSLHPALSTGPTVAGSWPDVFSGPTGAFTARNEAWVVAPAVRILFLCTHNSARSQMAEAIMRTVGGNQVEVYSAGSHPSQIHPLAVRVLQGLGIDGSAQRSKHMDEFSAEHFDYIITVCDRVREVCPLFPGDPHQMHWSIPDPTAIAGSEDEQLKAFMQTAQDISSRVRYLLPVIERETRLTGKA